MDIKKAFTMRASSIGDCLMGKYLLENVHAAYPDARCGIVVGSRGGMIRDLLHGYPWLEVFEANRWHPASLLHLFRAFHGSNFAVTQYAERPFSMPSKLMARLLTKRGGLVGFSDTWRWNSYVYDYLIPFPGEMKSGPLFLLEQEALRARHIPIKVQALTLAFERDSGIYNRFKLSPRRYILVHLFAGNEGRGLSPERRRDLLGSIAKHLPHGVPLVVTGSAGEIQEAYAAADGIPGTYVVAGKTNMRELINLIASSAGVVSVDTGAAHIAAHVGAPLIALTRCEAREAWWSVRQYPRGVNVFSREDLCIKGHVRGGFPVCLNEIDFKAVGSALSNFLSEMKA